MCTLSQVTGAVIVKINVDKMLRSLMVPRPPLRHFQDFVNGVAVGWDAEPAVGSHGKSGTNTLFLIDFINPLASGDVTVLQHGC